jgi:hypothetical protein
MGDRSEEASIDINRTSTHALNHSGLFQRATGQPGKDEVLLRLDVFQHAHDFDLKLLNRNPFKDCAPNALHPRTHFIHSHETTVLGILAGYRSGGPEKDQDSG